MSASCSAPKCARPPFGSVNPTITKSPVVSALILSQASVRPAAIRRVGALGDDALEAHRVDLREERLALALDVVERMHGAELRERVQRSSLRTERQRAQIEVLEREQVEREERRRQLDGGAFDRRAVDAAARAAAVARSSACPASSSTTTSPSTMHLVERERLHRARDFRETRRCSRCRCA